ncbi:YCF48-related protein [Thalassotalea fonticola]|uniref:YCF48-related protein n=1 Tax=Thalassotalea fonticola TaxID=3065649 RepID=A0ABZ0GRE5_9GAMM|nr:YCF48-related protein [Colwelliaceae bacterium S1-1]
MMSIFRHLPLLTSRRHYAASAFVACLGLISAIASAKNDALAESAMTSSLAQHSLLMDLDQVGSRLIAVGERGHILISEDNAISWKQMPVPVRVTLTASYFVDEKHGWAVGHDGVVLHTSDGGSHWQKQLDGRQANQLMLERAQAQLAKNEVTIQAAIQTANPEQLNELEMQLESLTINAEDAESFVIEGASRPFLDVWFRNDREGFIVGAYGLFLHTTNGGDSWQPWTEHIDNQDLLHLNAIRLVGKSLYIAAEAGHLFRSDDNGESWILLDSPYDGTFFGLIGAGDNALVAYGLRGNAFISYDQGNHWQTINTGIDASLFGSTRLPDGSVTLVGDGGFSFQINPKGQVSHLSQTPNKLPLSAVISKSDTNLLTVGLAGIQPISSQNIKP